MSWLINFLIVLYVSFGELGMYTAAIQLNAIILFYLKKLYKSDVFFCVNLSILGITLETFFISFFTSSGITV